MSVHVGAQDVGQDQGAAGVGLLARDAVPVAVAGRGQWVDREHLPLALPQQRNQQAARGLDRDRNRVLRAVAVLGEQFQRQSGAGHVVGGVPLGR